MIRGEITPCVGINRMAKVVPSRISEKEQKIRKWRSDEGVSAGELRRQLGGMFWGFVCQLRNALVWSSNPCTRTSSSFGLALLNLLRLGSSRPDP